MSHAAEMPIRWKVVLSLLEYRRRHRSYLKYLLHTDMHRVTCSSAEIFSLIHTSFEGDPHQIIIIITIIVIVIIIIAGCR